ncbi:MAG: serine/threonine protein kinase [Acidobacteriaceae bacterium]|nr:serine/threonine protein kinase [Acidobacteriaceae bacterium]
MSHFTHFGRYEIVRKLSRSLTDVYLARDSQTGSLVVLKLIEQSRDEFTELVIEAERRGAVLQRQLHETDPRILRIFDFGEDQNCFFVVIEYFEGRTLAELIREQGSLDPKRAARYAAEIASQLQSLHSFISDVDGRQTAVVHGDIKPSNVQIGGNDEVRLLDFGIAKVISLTRNLTHHNLGSPSYCSPERLRRGQVDAQSDVWALGVTLYEMIAGIPPYQAQNTRKLENLIQSRRPPRALPESCPAPLKAIITKCLSPRMENRYPSALALQDDLDAFLSDRATAAEAEPVSAWSTTPTVETEPGASRATRLLATTRTLFKSRSLRLKIPARELTHASIALAAGFLFGLFVLMPLGYFYKFHRSSEPLRAGHSYVQADVALIDSDWNAYQELQRENDFLGKFSPALSLGAPLRARLVAAADNIIDGYRNSPEPRLNAADWTKAQTCLRHALEMNPSDSRTRGKLALSNAYLELPKASSKTHAASTLQQFKTAESLLPESPDPHLGLTRLYVYGYRQLTPALAELRKAEELGYRPGPREAAETADGYLIQAEWELARAKCTIPGKAKQRWTALARQDIARARRLYDQIASSSDVKPQLQRLKDARLEEVALEAPPVQLIAAKQRTRRRSVNSRRWQ